MTESIEFLLTDEYQVFATQIASVHKRKKEKEDEVQALFTKAKAELGALDVEAKDALAAWETYKASKSKPAKEAK